MWFAATVPAAAQEVFVGEARAVDADTIDIGATRIQLHGIDGLETDQLCVDSQGRWPCGEDAVNYLETILDGSEIECKEVSRRRGLVIAICNLAGTNIAMEMVNAGWAFAYPRGASDYQLAEKVAEQTGAGAWAGEHMKPWEWRRR